MSKLFRISWFLPRNFLSSFQNKFRQNGIRFTPPKRFQLRKPSRKLLIQCLATVFNIVTVSKCSTLPLQFTTVRKYDSTYDIEKAITDIVVKAEEMILKNDMEGAKRLLHDALKIAEDTNVYGNISSVYDLLTTIALREGGVTEAEDMLANIIEKLLQLGYPEDHNSIIRFKLKLSRVYQTIGNREMAELGYRDCIVAQEKKLSKKQNTDDTTVLIYVNSLFWYGKLLSENGDFRKAKIYMKKTLDRMKDCSLIAPSQIMVVLYHNAEIATALKEYDCALNYLYKAIDLCSNKDQENPDLPLYVVKVGEIFLLKGLYENAEFWCSSAQRLAKNTKNEDAEKDATTCLRNITEAIRTKTEKPK